MSRIRGGRRGLWYRLSVVVAAFWFSSLASALGVDTENQSITISLRQEPPSLDSSTSEDTTSGQMLVLMNEGLVRIGPRGAVRRPA